MNQLIASSDLLSQRFYDAVFNSLDVRASTITDYKYRIKHFLVFVEQRGIDYNLLLSYKRSLEANEDYGVSTKNKYLTAATTFLRQCRELGFITTEINCRVSFFTQSKKHKKFGITENEASRICDWIRVHPNKTRETTMLCLLLFQGLRQAEVCNIKISDVNLGQRVVFVKGKGRDDKDPVHLHPNTYRILKTYIDTTVASDAYLFYSKSCKSEDNRLTERGLRSIIKSILSDLGIDKDVHGFRHYFTTHLIKMMPGELTKVAQFTRHRSLEMLSVYNDALLDEENNTIFDNAFEPLLVR